MALAAIFQDGVADLLVPGLKAILFDSEYRQTYI